MTNKDQPMLKNFVTAVDDSVLKDLFYAAQFALNDLDTVKRVSVETELSEERIIALTAIAIELSLEQKPEMTTEADVAKEVKKLTALKKEFEGVECGFVYDTDQDQSEPPRSGSRHERCTGCIFWD